MCLPQSKVTMISGSSLLFTQLLSELIRTGSLNISTMPLSQIEHLSNVSQLTVSAALCYCQI